MSQHVEAIRRETEALEHQLAAREAEIALLKAEVRISERRALEAERKVLDAEKRAEKAIADNERARERSRNIIVGIREVAAAWEDLEAAPARGSEAERVLASIRAGLSGRATDPQDETARAVRALAGEPA